MKYLAIFVPFLVLSYPSPSPAWYDKTHMAIAKAAGYSRWYHAMAADIAKLKAGNREGFNHFVSNPPGTVVTPAMVMAQIGKYDDGRDEKGHLYGAIIASLRQYIKARREGRYGVSHLAYCVHYVGDLSQPIHHTLYSEFNRRYHELIERIIDRGIMRHIEKIKLYPILIRSESDLAIQIARIANISLRLGYKIERQKRPLTREEGYRQLSHSASLLKAILSYIQGIEGGSAR